MNKKGFTLIELLVVIAIIAILSVVVILTLNPAELLKQARDSNRISDMSTLKSAISLYLSDVSSPTIGTSTNCYFSTTGSSATTTCGQFKQPTVVVTSTATNYRKVDATGWVPVNFNAISSGAPVGNLPVDPTNNQTLYYAYVASSTSLTFEIDAAMESQKYGVNAATQVVSNDGGDNNSFYEVGTAPGLAL